MNIININGGPLVVFKSAERPTPTDLTARILTSDMIGSYSGDSGVGFVITPYEDVEFTEWGIIAGRSYTASSGNNDSYIELAKIYEYNNDTVSILANYNTVSIYGRTGSSSGALGWYDKNFEGTGNSDRGLHKKYGEEISGYEQPMYKYKLKLTSGNKITLKAGRTYFFGCLPSCTNSNANETAAVVLNDIIAKTNEYNYFAKHRYDSTTLTKQADKEYLPYIELDGIPFNKFKDVNYTPGDIIDSLVMF